jgi:hypothetical protein
MCALSSTPAFFPTIYLKEASMSRRLSLAFLSAMFVYGISIVSSPPALAAGVNCDANVCISRCQKAGPQFGAGQGCVSFCLQTMEERKKKGQCK